MSNQTKIDSSEPFVEDRFRQAAVRDGHSFARGFRSIHLSLLARLATPVGTVSSSISNTGSAAMTRWWTA